MRMERMLRHAARLTLLQVRETARWLSGWQYALWRITGPLRAKETVSILFSGRDDVARAVCLTFFPSGASELTRIESSHPFRVARIAGAQTNGESPDLIVQQTPPWSCSSAPGDLVFQPCIETVCKLPSCIETYVNSLDHQMKSKARKALKLPVRFSRSRELIDLEMLHRDMLLPFAKERHGECCDGVPLDELKREWSRCHITFVENLDGQRIGGIVVYHSRQFRVWYLLRIGFPPDVSSERSICDLLNLALFMEVTREAMASGIERLYYGKVTPRKNSGLLVRQIRMGCRPELADGHPCCSLRVLTEKGRALIADCQPLRIENGRLVDSDL